MSTKCNCCFDITECNDTCSICNSIICNDCVYEYELYSSQKEKCCSFCLNELQTDEMITGDIKDTYPILDKDAFQRTLEESKERGVFDDFGKWYSEVEHFSKEVDVYSDIYEEFLKKNNINIELSKMLKERDNSTKISSMVLDFLHEMSYLERLE